MKTACLFLFAMLGLIYCATAQSNSQSKNHLNRNISVRFINQPLNIVLDKISQQGNFFFSYSGSSLRRDSIVSLSVQNKTVRDILDILFNGSAEYKESGNYIIIKSAIYRFNIEANDIKNEKNVYEVEGYIYNQKTGERIKNASVYEKRLLKSTLTDKEGYFKLKFKDDQQGIILTVSKEDYRDTTIRYLASINISPEGYIGDEASYSNRVERYGLSRFLVSSRQRVQSLNIPSFIANSPFQASLFPGLSSHGMLSSQIVNKGSLNILGGYTAGVNGCEVAGLFNINKKDVKKFQAAGTMNIVGGKVKGFQASGVFNVVMDSVIGTQFAGVCNNVQSSVNGVQAAGVINRTNKNFKGAQVAGVSNLTQGTIKGVQVAGVTNLTGGIQSGTEIAGVCNMNFADVRGVQTAGVINISLKSFDGTQVAGVINIAGKQLKGMQIAGVVNFARQMNGTQIGLVNIADTSSGYSIGLLNLIRKGYHKVSISGNEVLNSNLSIKTGNAKFYTMLMGGANFSDNAKAYSAGLGMGHDFLFNNRLSLAFELSSQIVFLGNKNNFSTLNRAQTQLQFQVIKGFSIFAGPSFSLYNIPEGASGEGYKTSLAPSYSKNVFKNDMLKSWMGWNAGITFM